MTKRAVLIISEQGLHSLMVAGISMGWVRAWLMSVGASEVSVSLLEENSGHEPEADWQLFYGSDAELNTAMQHCGSSSMQEDAGFILDNPPRTGWRFKEQGKRIVFLPVGDIAFQRHAWLSQFNDGKSMLPIYVRADNSLPIALEPGMSAAVSKPVGGYLNAEGLLIEEQVIAILKQHKLSIRTVESCTAGGIAARLCRVPGASEVMDRAWITYSNAAKQQEVGVASELLEEHGAVSEAVVRAMAEGGANASHVCLAVSGIAGPGGGTDAKPVGRVWVAFAMAGQGARCQRLHLEGSRCEVQSRTVIAALNLLLHEVDKLPVYADASLL